MDRPDPRRTDPRALRGLLAVARHRSFRRAAAELDLSPSALSHAVAAFEAGLGARLFHRTTRSVAPTDAGERLLARIEPLLREIDAALAEAEGAAAEPTGILRLNSSAAALPLVSPALAAFLRAHPAMRIELSASDALVDIVRNGFDAGIRLAEAVPQDMIAVPCTGPLRFAVVASPDYLARRGIPDTPEALSEHDCIRRRLGNNRLYAWEFERNGREFRVPVSGPLTADHEQPMIAAARAGLGLAYLRSWTADADLAAGTLREVLADWTPPHPGFRLYYPGHRHVPPGLRALAAAFRAAVPGGGGGRALSPPACGT